MLCEIPSLYGLKYKRSSWLIFPICETAVTLSFFLQYKMSTEACNFQMPIGVQRTNAQTAVGYKKEFSLWTRLQTIEIRRINLPQPIVFVLLSTLLI